MSQYPSPYSPPPQAYASNYAYFNAPDPRGPARRASVMMIVLGSLLLVLGLCVVGVGQMMRSTPLPAELASQVQQIESQTGVTLAGIMAVAGVVMVVFSLLMIALGIWVRGGGLVAAVLSIIATSVALLMLSFVVLFGTIGALQRGNPQAFVQIFIWGIAWVLFLVQLILLISAARASGRVAVSQQQLHAQYWQYQQNMQAYGGGGGYHAPMAPPPAPPNMPATPASQPPSRGDDHGPTTTG
jgi:hypothetical protein